MNTLNRYLLRQVLASLVMTVLVFTFVLLLGNVLKELLVLLVNRRATLGILTEAISLLIPFVFAFALQMGMLTATLLVFGRFSAEQEFTAARASGISLISLIGPVLVLSLVLCGVSAAINLEIAPRCRVAYTTLIDRLKVKIASAYLPEDRAIKDFKGFILFVGKNNEGELENVRVIQLENETNAVTHIRAPRGNYQVDPSGKKIALHLLDTKGIAKHGDDWSYINGNMSFDLDLTGNNSSAKKTHISDMTFSQLQDELRDLEQRVNFSPSTNNSTEALKTSMGELRKQKNDVLSSVRVQLHRQIALSFACFGFTLIGIPLGIRVHRRETNVNFAVALMLVFVYYGFVLVTQSMAGRPELAPHLLVWVPNFIFQAVGAVLLVRANRGI